MANYFSNTVDPIVCTKTFDDFEWEEITDVKDVSYTKSYYPDLDTWLCYHTYIPNGIFSTRNNIFLYKKMYIHNQNNFGKYFFGTYHTSIITPVLKTEYKNRVKTVSALFTNLLFRVDVIENKKINRNKTFSRLSVHNTYQSSSKIPLIPFNDNLSYLQQYDQFTIRLNHSYWQFNKFRDFKVDKRELTWEEWEKLTNIVFNQSIDQININNSNLNPFQNTELKKRFIDEYIIVMLEFDNNGDNNQFLLHEITCETRPALR